MAGAAGWLVSTVRKQRAGIDALLNQASAAKGHEQFVAFFIHLDICFVTKVKLSKIFIEV